MAEKKISEFPNFTGVVDSSTYFIVASGEFDNPIAKNYKMNFMDLASGVNHINHGDFKTPIYLHDDHFLFEGRHPSGPKNLVFATTGQKNFEITTGSHINFHNDVRIFGSCYSDDLFAKSGLFEEAIHLSGKPVLTGFDFAKDGDHALEGDAFNINIGGKNPDFSKNINFNIGGKSRSVIKGSGGIYHMDKVFHHEDSIFKSAAHFEGSIDASSIKLTGESNFHNLCNFYSGIHLQPLNDVSLQNESSLYSFNGNLLWGDSKVITENDLALDRQSYIDIDYLEQALENYPSLNDIPNLTAENNEFQAVNSFLNQSNFGVYASVDIEIGEEIIKIMAKIPGSYKNITFTSSGVADNFIEIQDFGGEYLILFGSLANTSNLITAFTEYNSGEVFTATTSGAGSENLTSIGITDFGNGSPTNFYSPVKIENSLSVNGVLTINGLTFDSILGTLENTISLLKVQISNLENEVINLKAENETLKTDIETLKTYH